MTYDEIYLEGYYDALLEAEKCSTKECTDDYSYSQKSKKDNGKYSKTTKVSISGDSKMMKLYDRYVTKCQKIGKSPMPFTKWVKVHAAADTLGVAALTTGAVIGGKKAVKAYRNKHPKVEVIGVQHEAYADGYFAALCEIEALDEAVIGSLARDARVANHLINGGSEEEAQKYYHKTAVRKGVDAGLAGTYTALTLSNLKKYKKELAELKNKPNPTPEDLQRVEKLTKIIRRNKRGAVIGGLATASATHSAIHAHRSKKAVPQAAAMLRGEK